LQGWQAELVMYQRTPYRVLVVLLVPPGEDLDQPKRSYYLICYHCERMEIVPRWTIGAFRIKATSEDKLVLEDLANEIEMTVGAARIFSEDAARQWLAHEFPS
jgi:hypothetical protein